MNFVYELKDFVKVVTLNKIISWKTSVAIQFIAYKSAPNYPVNLFDCFKSSLLPNTICNAINANISPLFKTRGLWETVKYFEEQGGLYKFCSLTTRILVANSHLPKRQVSNNKVRNKSFWQLSGAVCLPCIHSTPLAFCIKFLKIPLIF